MVTQRTAQERINDTGKEVDELSFVYRGVKCRRKLCRHCPHFYWYAHWREGAKVRVKYIGKQLPVEASDSWKMKRNARNSKA